MNDRSTIAIYGVGGAGINNVLDINIPSDAAGFPNAIKYIADISDRNLRGVADDKFAAKYLLPGVDGSGKNRVFTHSIAVAHIDKLLLTLKPKDVNVVIFSASGGSGSVLGPLIIEELLRRDIPVIGFCIITSASKEETINSFGTIGTLQNIATKMVKKPIVVNFHENTETCNREMVNDIIHASIRALASLLSGQNEELDKRDIENWLRPDRLSVQYPPQVFDLYIHAAPGNTIMADTTAVSVASLLLSKRSIEYMGGQSYNTVGYLPDSALNATSIELSDLHFIISNSSMVKRVDYLKSVIKVFQDAEIAAKANIVPEFDDSGDGSGWVF